MILSLARHQTSKREHPRCPFFNKISNLRYCRIAKLCLPLHRQTVTCLRYRQPKKEKGLFSLFLFFCNSKNSCTFALRNPCTAHVKNFTGFPAAVGIQTMGLRFLTVYQTPSFILCFFPSNRWMRFSYLLRTIVHYNWTEESRSQWNKKMHSWISG
jgi:hypothetical protein